MSYLKRLDALRPVLSAAFDAVAVAAMRDAYHRARPSTRTPEEPDFVASLVKCGVQQIKLILDSAFAGSGIQVTTTGVFCHQSPMVRFKHASKSQRCELGDILFVHIHRDKAGFVQRNALLLQAKMTEPSVIQKSIPKAEQHQLALYQYWPTFTYDMKGGPLNGKSRTVSPHVRHPGAQYLLIDSDPVFGRPAIPAGTYPMAVWMAETPVYTTVTLGSAFFQFLMMASGRQFSEKSGATGWSKVVWDLIENGLKKGFTRTRTGHISTPGSRMSGDAIPQYACFAMGHGTATRSIALDLFGPRMRLLSHATDDGSIPPGILADLQFEDPRGGISLVIVETDESQLRQEFADQTHPQS